MKFNSWINPVVVLAMGGALSTPSHLLAQSEPADAARTWKDLGFYAPAGYPTDLIPLFDGLDRSRGAWSFRGTISEPGAPSPLEGKLQISGGFREGMFPTWNLALGWPAEASDQAVHYSIIATPEERGFKLTLARIGPARNESAAKPPRAVFQGEWNPENRKILWTRMPLSALRPGLPAGKEAEQQVAESFEMVVGESGTITLQNPKPATAQGQIAGGTMARIGQPFVEDPALTKTRFDTAAEVSDPRVKPCLPPEARNITVYRERGGHFARYTVSEAAFHRFLDDLWKAEKEDSAHRRDAMHGEGEPANPESLAKRFEPLGWEPLKNAVIYYSPSKANGAMTTYYFDRETGIAYHDAGYW